MPTRQAILALLLIATVVVATAAKKKSSSAPTPAPAPVRADTVAKAVASPGPVSRTPGPLIKPGSPIEDRTTIAPFPLPGDTSRAASERAKTLNVPREGVTALEPLPPGVVAPEPMGTVPEPLTAPAPEYPKAARDAGIQGTVVVMVQVLADGTAGEVRVVKSIPALDSVAVQAVRRMRFKPTWWHGQPTPDWVGVPVKFTLH